MRNYQAYKWDDVLNEDVPKTMIGLELIKKEKDLEKAEYDKMNRSIPKK